MVGPCERDLRRTLLHSSTVEPVAYVTRQMWMGLGGLQAQAGALRCCCCCSCGQEEMSLGCEEPRPLMTYGAVLTSV